MVKITNVLSGTKYILIPCYNVHFNNQSKHFCLFQGLNYSVKPNFTMPTFGWRLEVNLQMAGALKCRNSTVNVLSSGSHLAESLSSWQFTITGSYKYRGVQGLQLWV